MTDVTDMNPSICNQLVNSNMCILHLSLEATGPHPSFKLTNYIPYSYQQARTTVVVGYDGNTKELALLTIMGDGTYTMQTEATAGNFYMFSATYVYKK